MADRGVFVGLEGSSQVGDRLHAAECEDDTHERDPNVARGAVQGLEVFKSQMRDRQRDDGDNDRDGWQGQRDRKTAAVFWPEIIDRADQKDHANGRDHDVILRNPEVAQRGPTTQSRRDSKVRNQQERGHDREDFPMNPGSGINSTPIREAAADDDIV